MRRFHKVFSLKTAGKYAAVLFSMLLLNFALPMREPVAFPLLFALLTCGLNPFVLAACYTLASVAALSFAATLCCALQAAFLCLVFVIYARMGRKANWERIFFLALAQLPFVFLYPHAGYALFPLSAVWQKAIIALFFVLLTLLFEGAVRALLFRAFRCRLVGSELSELILLWLFVGMGFYNLAGEIAFYALSLTLLVAAVVLLRNTAAIPFALALSLPLCAVRVSAIPLAEYALLSCFGLLFCPYGRFVSSLSVLIGFLGIEYFEGLYAQPTLTVIFTLLACLVPVAVCGFLPEKLYRKIGRSLLFYRERTLPRIAINRNRRALGEQLYEVSSLFREIETAFSDRNAEDTGAGTRFKERLIVALCTACPNRRKCREAGVYESFDKLIAVARAKGRANLIDLPTEISSVCRNAAGLLFALNKQLEEYRRMEQDLEAAREGRRLLAEQARGVSDILRDIALEQSEEYAFSDEEERISAALTAAGLMTNEIFLYGEGPLFTVSLTMRDKTDGKKLAKIAGEALRIPLALSEKIPLTSDRACFILRRKPDFDATFGIASRPKEGELMSGDTHSILKIDERRFLVALSDGMGSGENARSVSDRTLSLLESFYKAKMPGDTVLSTVNRLIALSGEETFSCLDVASVDLDTGEADIVKIGAPMGFLLSGEELRVLEGESLPIGMLEAVHPATMRVNMKAEDFLIFMSDGVTAAFGSSAELCDYLSGMKPLNPQSLAEEILKNALGRYKGKAEDDMTVLAVKLTRTA